MSVFLSDKLVLENLLESETQIRDARGDACSRPQLPHQDLATPVGSYYTTRQPARGTTWNLALRTRKQQTRLYLW